MVKETALLLYFYKSTRTMQFCSTMYASRYVGFLDGAALRRRTRDRKVAGSTPGRGGIKSTRLTQPSIPPG